MFRQLKSYQLVTDAVIAALFVLAALPFELTSSDSQYPRATAVGVVLVFAGALGVRRLSPAGALGIAWFGAVAQMALLLGPRPADFAIFAVLYATAAYGSNQVYWAGFASAFVGAVVITGFLFRVSDGLTLATVPIAFAVLVAALFALLLSWTAGAFVRTAWRARQNRAAQQRAEADAATEAERVRIARDMHDVVAHSLAVVIAQADGARYAAASDPDVAADALSTIAATARTALADVRVLLTQLRHSQIQGPQPGIAQLDELYAQVRTAGVDLTVDIDPAPPVDPPAAVQLAVYRILQEALTNALRHGDGEAVTLSLSWHGDRVDIGVGNGRSPDATAGTGHGLIGMRERAALAGGRLDAGADGGRFVVRATLPTGGAAAAMVGPA